jgi:hypothetical protein
VGRLEAEILALAANREALADLNGQRFCRFDGRSALKLTMRAMDNPASTPSRLSGRLRLEQAF